MAKRAERTGMAQLILDLPYRPAQGREDFLVAACNEAAVAWIERPEDWPNGLLVIHGPGGSGKTHLLPRRSRTRQLRSGRASAWQ